MADLSRREMLLSLTGGCIPTAKHLLHLDALEASAMRFAWGEEFLPASERIEAGAPRCPLLESIEELWDSIGYLQMQLERDHAHGTEQHIMLKSLKDITTICNNLQEVARSRGLGL